MPSIPHLATFLLAATPSLALQSSSGLKKIPSHAYVQVETDPAGVIWPWRVFKSSPFTPPNMTITGNGGALADGFIFMTPESTSTTHPADKENGGFIMTSDNEMVYALNVSGITDFRVESYKGSDYLIYWSGYNTDGVNAGHGYGQVNFINSTYGNFTLNPNLGLDKLVQTSNGNWSIDFHEHQLTAQNTIMVTAYNNTPYDLSSLGGPAKGWIVDSQVYELDIETGDILFSWKASEHVPLNESHQPIITSTSKANKKSPWDWFHVNAIQKVGDDYLINSRHCWSTYFVSSNGSVIWRFEGQTGGDFGAPPADGTFRWQHFARVVNVTATSLDLSLFDNHNSGISNGTGPSNGLVFRLKLPASTSYTPQLLRRIETPSDEIYADSQGDYFPTLSNGNQLLGYGQIAITREYGPATDGSDLRWQAQFGAPNAVQSYRAFKETWQATPTAWNPNLVVEDGYAYVSWNGATDVTLWNVYTTSGETVAKATTAKKGFETVFKAPTGSTLQVGAVQNGTEVRRSNIVQLT